MDGINYWENIHHICASNLNNLRVKEIIQIFQYIYNIIQLLTAKAKLIN